MQLLCQNIREQERKGEQKGPPIHLNLCSRHVGKGKGGLKEQKKGCSIKKVSRTCPKINRNVRIKFFSSCIPKKTTNDVVAVTYNNVNTQISILGE